MNHLDKIGTQSKQNFAPKRSETAEIHYEKEIHLPICVLQSTYPVCSRPGRSRHRVDAMLASGALSGPTTPAKGATQIQTSGGPHKLSIRDRQLVESLKNRGAHVIADYGNFVLLDANDALANSLAGNASGEIVDYNNLILLNARTIDTQYA